MAATSSLPLHPANPAMLHDLLSDSQDFVGAAGEGDKRSRKADEPDDRENKKQISSSLQVR